VAPFDLDADLANDQAFLLLMNSAVTLFKHSGDLEEITEWLKERAYEVVRFDSAVWATQEDFYRDCYAALDFPNWCGDNLDAFNDCLRGVAMYEYGADRDATGTVLVFTGYDAFARREPRVAAVILDVIATQARFAMLVGHRMLCLVQSNDPGLSFDPVGATPVMSVHLP
jgi:Barstar (barnase inhibitor)